VVADAPAVGDAEDAAEAGAGAGDESVMAAVAAEVVAHADEAGDSVADTALALGAGDASSDAGSTQQEAVGNASDASDVTPTEEDADAHKRNGYHILNPETPGAHWILAASLKLEAVVPVQRVEVAHNGGAAGWEAGNVSVSDVD
jgi:hypothetical protein